MTDSSLPKPQPPQSSSPPSPASSQPPQSNSSPSPVSPQSPPPPQPPFSQQSQPPVPPIAQSPQKIGQMPPSAMSSSGQSGQGVPPIPPLPNISESPDLGNAGNQTGGTAGQDEAGKKTADTQTSQGGGEKPPRLAKVKKSPFRFLPFILGGLVVIGAVIFLITRVFGGSTSVETPVNSNTPSQGSSGGSTAPTKQVSLTYWGLWEPTAVLEGVLQDFQQQNPGVTVNYIKQSHQDYRERLQTGVASGNGPDVFRYHMTWVPMLRDELAAMPQSVMSASEYKQTFYPSAAQMLNNEGQIVGIPLMYDGLALYYNKQYLTAADAEPPTTWAELKSLASQLTIRNSSSVQRGGLAIGNASNVEHFSDILGLLMLQNGADLTEPNSPETRDAIAFYTNFVTQDKVWSDSLPSSTVAFARGDAAMMFAPSWRVHEIQSINPELDFGIAAVPRLGDEPVGWASFWAEGVSSKSDNQAEAWQLLKFLSSAEVQQKLYSAQSQNRAFGEIYSRTDLADQLAGDQLVSPFLEDAPIAESWYLASYTHDSGINDLLIKYYRDAVNAVLGGETVDSVLPTLEQGTNQVLRQYGVE